MKVLLYLENASGLSNSGIGRAILHQSEALKLAGVDFTFDPNDTYDLAHINSYGPKSYRLLKKCHKRGIKVIVHGHSTHEDFRNSFRLWQLMAPFYDHWMNRMYKRADMVITPTAYSKGLISSYKNVKCPVKNITNGIALEEYAPNQKFVDEFIKKFDISEKDKVVVGAGFPFYRKGILDFFSVAKNFPDVKFIWFGSLDKILTQHKILKAIKKRPSNVLMPGYIKGDIIKGAYQRASCMLFPTYEETEGIVALEALASYTPLIIRDVGVYKDWLENGVNCYKGNNVEDFTALVKKNLDKKDEELVKKGYQVVEQRSMEKTGQMLKEAYQELLETNIK